MRKTLGCLLAISCALALACAPSPSVRTYSVHDAGTPLRVEKGWVDSVRPVKIQGPVTGAGATAGMAVGMAAGSGVGEGAGTALAMVGGAILGGLIGAAAEQGAATTAGQEIVVQMEDGTYLAFVQEAKETFAPGDEVQILTAPDGTGRVQHPRR